MDRPSAADESAAVAPAAVEGGPVEGGPGRLRLTSYAALQLACWVPALVLLVLLVVGGALSVVWVGLPLLALGLPALRRLADLHRRMAADILGSPVPAPYRGVIADGPLLRLREALLDPTTWRDLVWVLWTLTLGFALSLVVVLLLVVVVTAGLWWYAVGPLMTIRAQVDRLLLTRATSEVLTEQVGALTRSRARAVDASAAELRRIERDLHDGPQARLVALSMNLGLAESLLDTDPELAQQLVSEARSTSRAVLGELRAVVRGIHPPVLADRGLGPAVEALALDMALPVEVDNRLPGRPPPPVESALYFGVAEGLANVGKHAGAARAWVRLGYVEGRVRVEVGDDGRGGADPRAGSGLRGVAGRLDALAGTLGVSSPPLGPTVVTLEVPCPLTPPSGSSSLRTASSSVTD